MGKIICVIIGTLIGAGFASGQEINIFFYSYGNQGMVGFIVSTVIMSFVIWKVLGIIKKYQIKNYKELLYEVVRSEGNKLEIINNVVNIFVLITFFIMIAGFGAYFQEQLHINHIVASAILAFICYFIFQKNVEGVIKVNQVVIPILIISVLVIGIKTLSISQVGLEQMQARNTWAIISSLIYAGYNSILLIPVLITLREKLKDGKQITRISVISGAIIMLLGIIIFNILSKVGTQIDTIEMPIAYVVSKMSLAMQVIYGAVIILSIFTTSVSLGNSFLNSVTHRKVVSICMCLIAVLTSNIGFSKLIEYAYPLFGILGMVQIIKILKVN